ncbi:hypothetical protein BMS3Abin16_01876 [archaeon BMS3Abin16]|nr:hypothetical protein BMS3Abin16_01876 [archaeon BMS3Abin16]
MECESQVLKGQRGRKTLFTLFAGVLMIGALFLVWSEYSGRQSEVDTGIVTGTAGTVLAQAVEIARSPFIVIPLLLVAIFVAFYWGVKLTR